jgi:N-acetylglucosaminyldiphosphoundecaprenol N-acetyl-beta-D-mannosaminyltransferase
MRSRVKQTSVLQGDRRVGRDGREFLVLSFRDSLVPSKLFKLRSLPALLNVLSGEMAIIGPRALRPEEASLRDRGVRRRSSIRPGVISLWWVRKKANIDYSSELAVDLEYVDQRSSSGDLGIALRSVPALLSSGSQAPAPEYLKVLGVPIRNVTMDDALQMVLNAAKQSPLQQICFVNTDCVNRAQRDVAYAELLRKCDVVFGDGIGIRIAGKILGQRILQNVNGTDLLPLLCAQLQRSELGIFLLGGRPGVAEAVAAWVQARYPGTRVKGTHHGYFPPSEESTVIGKINDSGAEMLMVAFGAPRQDTWIDEHRDELHVSVAMGVGGLFDFYSGMIPRAPQWLRELSLEWVFRLYQEPGRMWKRYLVGNILFLWRVCISALVRETPRETYSDNRGR